MTKSSFLFLIFTFCLVPTFAQKNTQASLWRDSAIVIDGHPEDWDLPFRFYDSKSKLQYSVVNDATNLYICIMSSDPRTQMKITRAGMKVWLDTTGKKKETSALYYPLKGENKLDISPDPAEPEKNIVEHPDAKKLRLNFLTSQHDAKTLGMKGVPATIIVDDSNKADIKLALNWDKNEVLAYEIKIPFKTFYKDALTPQDTLKPLAIGVKIEGMVMPMIPNNSNAGADVSGAGGGGTTANRSMNGSGRQTNGPTPSMALPQSVAELAESLQIYMRIKLAIR